MGFFYGGRNKVTTEFDGPLVTDEPVEFKYRALQDILPIVLEESMEYASN